ncbi:sigma-70 family RNA polymerase sigma factor [Streptomyces sp. NPDC020141]|uniref:sigma-70 family RNA polymerase sigma factor n=1 Tax=Streptomyces sp. NPDC020141 TaxID=3365065 RepID=UPI00379B0E3C
MTPRPGRKLGLIDATVGTAHRAWLEPVREHYLASGQTLSDLSAGVPLAKSKLSELLRGVGHYPRWEVVYRLAVVLDIPSWPLHRLWKHAALDAGKSRGWVDRSTERAPAVTASRSGPPLDHGALRTMTKDHYLLYAGAFLPDETCEAVVEDAFALLWLTWAEALASPDTRRYAWSVLRAAVMAGAEFRDGRPVLTQAAFDTVALRVRPLPADQAAQLTESLGLFAAFSRLPDAQLDVMVLRRMCGFTHEEVSSLLGVPKAAVRSDERHAERFLDDTDSIEPPHPTGGTTR